MLDGMKCFVFYLDCRLEQAAASSNYWSLAGRRLIPIYIWCKLATLCYRRWTRRIYGRWSIGASMSSSALVEVAKRIRDYHSRNRAGLQTLSQRSRTVSWRTLKAFSCGCLWFWKILTELFGRCVHHVWSRETSTQASQRAGWTKWLLSVDCGVIDQTPRKRWKSRQRGTRGRTEIFLVDTFLGHLPKAPDIYLRTCICLSNPHPVEWCGYVKLRLRTK